MIIDSIGNLLDTSSLMERLRLNLTIKELQNMYSCYQQTLKEKRKKMKFMPSKLTFLVSKEEFSKNSPHQENLSKMKVKVDVQFFFIKMVNLWIIKHPYPNTGAILTLSNSSLKVKILPCKLLFQLLLFSFINSKKTNVQHQLR